MGIDLASARLVVSRCEANIKALEKEIERELDTKNRYRKIVLELQAAERSPGSPKPRYDLKSMEVAVQNCDKNVCIIEGAIRKDTETKLEYQRIIRALEEAEAAKPKVEVEVVRENEEADDDPLQ